MAGAVTAVDPRSPCLVGVAQRTWRPTAPDSQAPEPLAMWEEVARAAIDDAGAAGDLLGAIGSLDVVYCQSWQYDDPTGRLAASLGIAPARAEYSGIGGTTPQLLVDEVASRMLRGEADAALVVGAEALDTKRRLKKAGERPAWSHRHPNPPPFPFEAPFLDTEIAHEVFQAWLTFATFDVARRAARGTAPETYRHQLGALLAPMSGVAARNPHAWFPTPRTAEELITPTAENRLVGHPYTKYMISVMDVDMAGALVLTTHERADALSIPPERRVYLRGWCYLTEPYYLAQHRTFHASPAMAKAAATALDVAGVGVDDVAHLDLYSCFASSVNFALDALGLDAGDPRGVTVTGGLPFSGGAGSDYLTHSIATMAGVLREDPGSFGLVSGVGMHMTKHVYGVYSTLPPSTPIGPPDEAQLQAELDAVAHPEVVDEARGSARLATYAVVHGRDGEPAWALGVCDLPDGRRAYARGVAPGLLASLEAEEWVGRDLVLVDGGNGVNLIAV